MIHADIFTLASSLSTAGQRIGASWPWYVIRAAGFTAAGLIVALMLSGIGQVTGITYRFLEPVKAWVIHKALAIALCVAIAVHIGFLLIDSYVHFNFAQLFIPFLSRYNNKTQLFGLSLGWAAVAMGIIAMYGVAIIVASSLGWIDSRKKTWRKFHFISYGVAILVFIHAMYAGSDLQYGIFRAFWILMGIVVAIGIVMRLRRAGSLRHKPDA